MIDFPANPTQGQQFTAAGVVWVWDGAKWTPSGLGQAYLPLSGGTLTGPLVLPGDPTIPLGAATAQYADKPRYGDNRIINGDMTVAQRGISGIAGGYTVDRWQYFASVANQFNYQQSGTPSASASYQAGFPLNLQFTSASAYTPVAADTLGFWQPIEGGYISDFAWGTANAQPVTLSFWAMSSLTGLFGGTFQSYATPSRSYPFTYSLPTANIWTKIVITIPGDTAGTSWSLWGNQGALGIIFDLGSGANNRGPANAWASAQWNGANGTVNVCATANATFQITGVKLEIGSIATPFNRQSLAKSLADCQRYYQYTPSIVDGGWSAGGGIPFYRTLSIPPMRAAPTATYLNIGYNNSTNLNTYNVNALVVAYSYATNSVGNTSVQFDMTLSAEL